MTSIGREIFDFFIITKTVIESNCVARTDIICLVDSFVISGRSLRQMHCLALLIAWHCLVSLYGSRTLRLVSVDDCVVGIVCLVDSCVRGMTCLVILCHALLAVMCGTLSCNTIVQYPYLCALPLCAITLCGVLVW